MLLFIQFCVNVPYSFPALILVVAKETNYEPNKADSVFNRNRILLRHPACAGT